MKLKIFPLVAFSLLVCASACSSETSQNDEPKQPAIESSNTLTIRLTQSDFTRATPADEAKVNSLNVVFLKDKTFIQNVLAEKSSKEQNVFKVKVPGSISDHPDGIIAFANTSSITDQSLEALRNRKISDLGNSDNGFVMSCVSTFDDSNAESLIVPVSFANFTESGTAVSLQLERLCAKVTLEKASDFTDNTEVKVNDKSLGVFLTIDGWLLSSTDKDSYLFKKLGNNPLEGTWWKGSVNELPVTHWAFSSNYGSVPSPSDNSSAKAVTTTKYALASETPLAFSNSVYAHETTRPASCYADQNTLPSIVIVGTYRMSEDQNAKPVDLYRLSDGSFKSVDDYWNLIAQEPAMLKKTSGTTTVEDLKKVLTIDNHVAGAPDRIMEIKIKDGIKEEELKPFDKSLADVEIINTYLKEKFGYAEKYDNGKCYFVVPIQHKNYKTETAADKQPEGAFGIVRNHHYTITLKGLSGVGYGVADQNSYLLNVGYNASAPQYNIQINSSINNWSEISGQTIE